MTKFTAQREIKLRVQRCLRVVVPHGRNILHTKKQGHEKFKVSEAMIDFEEK